MTSATTSVSAVPVPRLCKKYTRSERACLCSPGYALKCIVPRLKIIQDVNEHVYTVPGTSWNTRYPDWVRNIHVVNGHGYTFPGEVK